ncbi:MAG: Exonuclease SbcCD subunit D [Bacteroidales bacterium]
MKLIHTADWHIGQTFFEYDRKAEHLQFLAWLKGQIKDLSADALLIAGDVFDSSNPSAESQRMFYRFLREATAENPSLQIVVIAGNHDSAARLEAPNPLLEEMRVTVRGIVKRTSEGDIDYAHFIVPLMKGDETAAWCLAVPYLRQGDYPEAENYAKGVGGMYKLLYEKVPDKSKPVVVMGHLQAAGAEVSENDRSERTITGGLESISPDAFSRKIAYTALGHLHRAQRVAGRKNVRYAGSPLPMSFAEKNNRQGITLIDIARSPAKIEHIVFDPPVKLMSIPQEPEKLPEVLEAIGLLPDGEITSHSPYLEIKVLITDPEPSLRHWLEEALKNKSVRLARIAAVIPKAENGARVVSCEDLQTIHPMDMALDIFRRKFGGEEMPEGMRAFLQSVIREVEP